MPKLPSRACCYEVHATRYHLLFRGDQLAQKLVAVALRLETLCQLDWQSAKLQMFMFAFNIIQRAETQMTQICMNPEGNNELNEPWALNIFLHGHHATPFR